MNRYEQAKEIYKNMGVDTDAAIKKLQDIKISIHCWQGDDVGGFESSDSLSGGIAVTGNYPYKATNATELMQDIDKALTLIPGTHRINLHAIYAITDGESVSRDKLEPKHFDKWIAFAKERGLGLDFNPTLFSHEKVVDGLTLSSPKDDVRKFWIDHCKATRKIAEYIGKELGSPCLHNIWIPDGFKDVPADKLAPRLRLKNSLDEIYSEKLDKNCIIDSVESKVFGLGMESYTTGSHEFYLNYASKNNILCLLDNGHFHPTEKVSDKISSMLLFSDKVALHVTRPVRWDSDHVVLFDEELVDIAKEIIRCDATERVLIGLDYFDASINRIAAWVVGTRNTLKALMFACLMPNEKLQKLQDNSEFTELMILHEELKLYPFADVWDHYCELNNVPVKSEWLKDIKEYEEKYLSTRNS